MAGCRVAAICSSHKIITCMHVRPAYTVQHFVQHFPGVVNTCCIILCNITDLAFSITKPDKVAKEIKLISQRGKKSMIMVSGLEKGKPEAKKLLMVVLYHGA